MTEISPEILVLDDDIVFCEALRDHLEMRGYTVSMASCIRDATRIFKDRNIDVAFIDKKLPDGDGLKFSEELIRSGVETKNVLITAFAGVSAAVEAIRAGVFDYLQKPVSLEALEKTLQRALRTEEAREIKSVPCNDGLLKRGPDIFVGSSQQASDVRLYLQAIADAHPSPVLITGETGTGKGLAARIIQSRGPVSDRQFVTINCAAIPETMFEAELFGYERGAFTGAYRSTKGLFQIADGGTLLLDEIGEVPLPLQAKLLRVLEDGLVRRLGGHLEHKVRVRVLASTNRDLKALVDRKQFRADLYYRLAVLHIDLPPLRSRSEDIPELIQHLTHNQKDKLNRFLSPERLKELQEYHWPGNVRELRNVMERMLTFADNQRSVSSHLLLSSPPRSDARELDFDALLLKQTDATIKCQSKQRVMTLAELENLYIEHILVKAGGNRTKAAKWLGLSRSTLKRWLRNQTTHSLDNERRTIQ